MATVTIRIGNSDNVLQYDDGEFPSAIETTEPLNAGSPVNPSDVLILGTTGVTGVVGPATSTDHAIVRFNGTDGTTIQNSLVTIDDAGSFTLPAGEGIGIGTAPSYALHVVDATNPTVFLQDTTNTCQAFLVAQNTTVRLGSVSNHAVYIQTNSADRIGITNAGVVNIGDAGTTNYASFEVNGHLVLFGTATVFNDIQFSLSTAKVPAANFPSWDVFSGNLKKFTFAINDFVYLEAKELSHSYKTGSNYEWHIHIFTNVVDGTDRTVKYEIEYSITDVNAVVSVLTESQQFTIPASTADLTHLKFSISGLDGTGLEMEDDITVLFKRIATDTGTDPSIDPFVSMVGLHYEVDTIGSRTEEAK